MPATAVRITLPSFRPTERTIPLCQTTSLYVTILLCLTTNRRAGAAVPAGSTMTTTHRRP